MVWRSAPEILSPISVRMPVEIMSILPRMGMVQLGASPGSLRARFISSTSSLQSRNVSSPTCLTATPSANSPTWGSVTRRPAASERAIASESTGCTPTMRMSGRTRFT